MTKDEAMFLAQVTMGWFSIREDGAIWRHIELHGGGVATVAQIEPRRAECSISAEGGYPRVMFTHMGERLKVSAHRIVWIYFNRRPIPTAMEINHIDGNKGNSRPSNLELVTRSENVRHACRVLGRRPKAQDGEANAQAKVTAAQVMEIRALFDAKALSQREIGARFGLTQSAVSAIVRRESWRHVEALASTG